MAIFMGRGPVLAVIGAVGLLLAGCAETPMGPTVQVMPGPGKSFEQFRIDQANCKGYAADQVRGQAEHANQRAVGAAALTTALGVGVGALAGSVTGNMGAGAAIGGAAGLGVGAGIGAGNSGNAQYNIQQQYDNAFAQCMFAKGEQVPGYQHYSATPAVVPGSGGAASYGPDPALVRSTQQELIRLGYLHGAADGAMGPQTAGAIRAYERANGLPVDGAVSEGLLARLQSTQGSAAAQPGWVSPTTGQPTVVTPASNPPASGAPSGWVTPKS